MHFYNFYFILFQLDIPNYDDGTSLWGQQQAQQQQQPNQQQSVQQQQQQQQPVPLPQNRTGLPVFKGSNLI